VAVGVCSVACFRPWYAWAPVDGGPLLFRESKNCREVKLPCGKCVGCMQVRQRNWALRICHEAQMHEATSFVTLTYRDPFDPSLNYSDFQRFMYRLRQEVGPTRFFCAGEYGSKERTYRPHFHAVLFGLALSDRLAIGDRLYRSPLLEKLWPFGFSSVGDVSMQSAMYVAKYSVKVAEVVRDGRFDSHYSRVDIRTGEVVSVVPEFAHMSLRPGIGAPWFDKYWRDVYGARDGCVQPGGAVLPPPRFYDVLLDRLNPAVLEFKKYERYVNAARFLEDTSPSRLAAREVCAIANHKRKESKL
jgi:hypothetical protein